VTRKAIGPSEFEGEGVKPFGGFGLARAWEKLRFIVRTGESPEGKPDLDAPPNDWGSGGLRDVNDKIDR